MLTSSTKDETHLAPKLRELVETTESELFLVTPYFVPGKNGVALLAGARRRGVRVVVLTNSLASTDAVPVHSGYRRYRRALLEAGVELYEVKPTASSRRRRSGGGWFGSIGSGRIEGRVEPARQGVRLRPPDRFRRLLQSRSPLQPAEHRDGRGLRMPVLGEATPEEPKAISPTPPIAWNSMAGRLEWVTYEGDTEVRHATEPASSLGSAAKSGCKLAADRMVLLITGGGHWLIASALLPASRRTAGSGGRARRDRPSRIPGSGGAQRAAWHFAPELGGSRCPWARR